MIAFLGFTSGMKVSVTEKVAVIDYETEYDDVFSVSKMSYWHYTRDPRFRAHTVSIVSNTGVRWAGDPKDAPWGLVRDCIWVSHNRPFDQNVHDALRERGIVPEWAPMYWGDSMALCAYLRIPRALAKAVNILYGIKHSKDIRDKEIKGKKWEQMSPDLQKRVREYACVDGDLALRIWLEHIHLWPTKELRISDLITNRGLKGVAIDREGCQADMGVMKRILFAAEQKIPWRETGVILSSQHLAAECRKHGIEPPPSLDMKDEACAAWEDKYGDQFPWVAAMRDWRRMNSLLQKYEMIVGRIKPDGRAEFSIKYMGTHTGRTAAGEKGYDKERETFNLLNLPRSPFYVRHDLSVVSKKGDVKRIEAHIRAQWMVRVKACMVEQNVDEDKAKFLTPTLPSDLPADVMYAIDLRRKIIPGPGRKFAICDMSQIEARVTNWLGRDKRTLDFVRSGLSVYDAHAITLMGYKQKYTPEGKLIPLKKDAPGTYSLAKARELALGYQSGHIQFIIMAPTYVSDEEAEAIFSAPITPDDEEWYLATLKYGKQTALLEEYPKLDRKTQVARVNAQIQVQQFRDAKKWLPLLWRKLDKELRRSAGGTHQVELPSGRILEYFDVTVGRDGVQARVERGGNFKFFYGGKILANTVSATARDIFVHGQLALDDAGIDVILDIYDENVCEVPLDFPKERVAEIMTRNPEWAKSLPLGAEVEESMFYKK